jgi:hypothetical protein
MKQKIIENLITNLDSYWLESFNYFEWLFSLAPGLLTLENMLSICAQSQCQQSGFIQPGRQKPLAEGDWFG